MGCPAFKLKSVITVVVRDVDRFRLVRLLPGSVFYATGSKPDPNGMIDGTCDGEVVMLFARDLEERAERMAETSLSEEHPTRAGRVQVLRKTEHQLAGTKLD